MAPIPGPVLQLGRGQSRLEIVLFLNGTVQCLVYKIAIMPGTAIYPCIRGLNSQPGESLENIAAY
ncbi:hypothetical protein CHELA20_50401 [Hyphomicrobiales bacterium]|nr:hypothetical protein CHELA20_50401 [Hyphomicrobiales bacterium]